MEIEWANLKAGELRQLARGDTRVIIPIGSTEQHGPHLPVQVDTLLATEVAHRAARKVASRVPVVVTPAVWIGLAEHHMTFGGTLTLDFDTLAGLLRCIVRSLVRHGFRQILFLNGHGGNVSALRTIVDELTPQFAIPLIMSTYWVLAEEQMASILERQSGVKHAGEAETSMMLALRPDLVDTGRLSEAIGPTGPESGVRSKAGTHRWSSFAGRTETGVIGDASAASAEKGERLLEAATAALSDLLVDPGKWRDPVI